jgi:hypothetical protein
MRVILTRGPKWLAIDNRGILYVCRGFRPVVKKPYVDANGLKYTTVAGRNRHLHRIVAEAFVPNPNALPALEFIDGDRGHVAASNLRWCPRKRHASGGRALTAAAVRRIKSLLSRGDSAASVARTYGVHRSLISHIKAGRRWASV